MNMCNDGDLYSDFWPTLCKIFALYISTVFLAPKVTIVAIGALLLWCCNMWCNIAVTIYKNVREIVRGTCSLIRAYEIHPYTI